ncbi:Probable carboxylesterase 2 [Linum grandiflorum]
MADAEPSHPNQPQVATEFPGTIKINTDGTIHRLRDTDFVPPSSSSSGVSSKDVLFHPDSNLSARLHLPPSTDHRKLPLVLYFHGGGFCISSPFCSKYNRYASRIAAESQSLVVSFDYRKAPEHPIPAAYEDSWAGLLWAASHQTGNGPEPWLNEHADFGRIFLAGDSAGGNIVHNLAMAAGNPEFGLEMEILGAALVHPYFWGSELIGSEAIYYPPEAKEGNDDPRVNPVAEDGPGLVGLGCRRVLVCVAEKDVLRDRGWMYYEAKLVGSGWKGTAEFVETEGKDHVFHIIEPDCVEAKGVLKRLAYFFNDQTFVVKDSATN